MKYFIIAGEPSGDLHGGSLVEQIYKNDEDAIIIGWGGKNMESKGMKKLKDYKDLAFMGFVEVVQHLPKILQNIKDCKNQILEFQPDVIVFIDYPGFNLRIAKWAKEYGFKTAYYISPQVWAWKENRINSIKKHIDEMLVILPFEKQFYAKHGVEVKYVGHPMTERVMKSLHEPFPKSWSKKPIIGLLPGSRKQEVKKHLSIMEKVATFFHDYDFYISKVSHLDYAIYEPYLKRSNVHLFEQTNSDIFKLSEAIIVASGTATLEAALYGTPQVVCYKGNWVSYILAKSLIKVPYISLVNLILNKNAVEELIQEDCNATMIATALQRLFQSDKADALQQDYTKLWEVLGQKNASFEASKAIIKLAHS